MRLLSTLLFCALTAPLFAQPTVPAQPPSNLFGNDLRVWLKANWYTGLVSPLDYDGGSGARAAMYSSGGIDRVGNSVTCVYTGFVDGSINSVTFPDPINTEHTIPQSFFNQDEPQRGDIHHLFPTHQNTNSARSSDPFGEVPDGSATWYGASSTSGTSTTPTSNINDFSERSSGGWFEPREDHKGDVARALFYFFTMHPGTANRDNSGNTVYTPPPDDTTGITRVVYTPSNNTQEELLLLYSWHLNDPPSAKEIARNTAVAKAQGNYNPYINYPELVAKAFNITATGSNSISTSIGITALTAGQNLTVNWTAVGTFNAGNQFQVQLSGADGSFSTATTLGSQAGTGNGSLVVTVPDQQAPGTQYRVRVISTDPNVVGSESAAFTINNGLTISSVVPTSIAREESFTVSYTSTGAYTAGNEFRVVLSSSTGSFNSGTRVIGTLATTSLSGTINATMPADAPLTASVPLVRIRVEATNPVVVTSASAPITITVATSLEGEVALEDVLRVGPNPTEGDVHVFGELASPEALTIRLLDSAGRLLYSTSLPPRQVVDAWVPMQHLAPGVYHVLVAGQGRSGHWRVLRR